MVLSSIGHGVAANMKSRYVQSKSCLDLMAPDAVCEAICYIGVETRGVRGVRGAEDTSD